MKRLAIAVVLLVVLLSVSGYSLWSLRQLTTQLTQTAQQLRELPTDGPLEEASRDLVRQWEKAEDQLVLYVNHEKLEGSAKPPRNCWPWLNMRTTAFFTAR